MAIKVKKAILPLFNILTHISLFVSVRLIHQQLKKSSLVLIIAERERGTRRVTGSPRVVRIAFTDPFAAVACDPSQRSQRAD